MKLFVFWVDLLQWLFTIEKNVILKKICTAVFISLVCGGLIVAKLGSFYFTKHFTVGKRLIFLNLAYMSLCFSVYLAICHLSQTNVEIFCTKSGKWLFPSKRVWTISLDHFKFSIYLYAKSKSNHTAIKMEAKTNNWRLFPFSRGRSSVTSVAICWNWDRSS